MVAFYKRKELFVSLPMNELFVAHPKSTCEDHTMNAGQGNRSIENLIELIQDNDPLVRVHAGFALGSIGEEALPAVPVLIEMLENGGVQDRKLAATTLGKIGPVAAEAIPALLEAATDEDDGVADLAVRALEEIDLADTDEEAEAKAA